ncbi:MAG: hypothetical protein LH473_00925, partial [Chitinophagales bacterium]|nr:hypothetical protein [Chitinophagales bacterium]
RVLNPFHFNTAHEITSNGNNRSAKIYADGKYTITYPKKKRGLDIRAFTGVVIFNNASNDFHLSAANGIDDYRYENAFLGRTEQEGFLSQQISMNDDGGFAMRTTGVTPRIGESDSWLFAVNLKARIPFFMPLYLFADLGFAPNDNYDVFQYDAGIGFTLLPDVVEIYLPLSYSSDIKTNLISTPFYEHWYQRISFTFNIEKLNPFELIRNIKL